MKLVLHGRFLKAREAFDANIVDHLVASRDALADAARDAVAGKIERRAAPGPSDMAAVIADERAALMARTSPRNMPAPFGILNHYSLSDFNRTNMMKAETNLFSELMMTPASAGMRRNFQLTDAVKKGGRGDHDVSQIHVILSLIHI